MTPFFICIANAPVGVAEHVDTLIDTIGRAERRYRLLSDLPASNFFLFLL
jgi:hypothetical protein